MSGAAATRGDDLNGHVAIEREADFRAWLFLLMSLTATVSFTAGLAPPGGVWGADDKDRGYVAGEPVLRDKYPSRYSAFYYCNTSAFYSSLMVIAMLAKPDKSKRQRLIFGCFVVLCYLSLIGSYVAATAVDTKSTVFNVVLTGAFTAYAMMLMFSKIWLYFHTRA